LPNWDAKIFLAFFLSLLEKYFYLPKWGFWHFALYTKHQKTVCKRKKLNRYNNIKVVNYHAPEPFVFFSVHNINALSSTSRSLTKREISFLHAERQNVSERMRQLALIIHIDNNFISYTLFLSNVVSVHEDWKEFRKTD
jgi:hypothetical protein